MIKMRAAFRFRNDFVDNSKLLQVVRGNLQRFSRRPRPSPNLATESMRNPSGEITE